MGSCLRLLDDAPRSSGRRQRRQRRQAAEAAGGRRQAAGVRGEAEAPGRTRMAASGWLVTSVDIPGYRYRGTGDEDGSLRVSVVTLKHSRGA